MKLFQNQTQNMNTFPESELILNKDGSVYHLNLLPEHIADTIITVGDPGRVHKVTKYFDDIDFEMNKREFITQTGTCNNKRVTVISSGMGTDNVEILMTELDALANIDLKKRVLKEKRRRLKIIRIGTSGSLQNSIPVDSCVVSNTAIGLDTIMCFYQLHQTHFENTITEQLQQKLSLPFQPYCVSGSAELKEQIAPDMIEGNTVTCPGFYAPQGRKLRLDLKNTFYFKRAQLFSSGRLLDNQF